MRIKLIACVAALLGIFSWAVIHQISKKEALPSKLKLYALYTPETILQETQEAFAQAHAREYDLILYKKSNEATALATKVDTMLSAIKENWGSVFMYCELNDHTEVPGKETVLKILDHTDLAFEQTENNLGAGCIACRANKRTLHLWQTIKHMMDDHPDLQTEDYLNQVLHKNKIAKLRWDYLPHSPSTHKDPIA